MSPPISSPVSSNSFPSSTTSKGYDENNNFNFSKQPGWPPALSARKLVPAASSPGTDPLSSSQSNLQSQQAPRPVPRPGQPPQDGAGWQLVDTISLPATATAASPKPPRSAWSSKPQTSPSRVQPPVRTASTPPPTMINRDAAQDPRQALAPRSSERLHASASAAALESLEAVRRQSDSLHQQVQQYTATSGSRPPSTSNNGTPSRTKDAPSIASQTSAAGESWKWETNQDPDNQEQALFEQRLTEDIYGVAVRKINHNGKSNLRYVKCCFVDAAELEMDASGFSSSSRSVSSNSRPRFGRFRDRSVERGGENRADIGLMKGKQVRVLTWGKKKDVRLPVERFVCVRKGKTTDRTRRNICPASRILSLITDDPNCPSLDIEAPTRLDRDKFARAFARFLKIPLDGDDVRSIRSDMTPQSWKDQGKATGRTEGNLRSNLTSQLSTPDVHSYATNNSTSRKHIPLPVVTTENQSAASARPKLVPPPPSTQRRNKASLSTTRATEEDTNPSLGASFNNLEIPDPQITSLPSTEGTHTREGTSNQQRVSLSREASTTERHTVSVRSQPAAAGVLLKDDGDEASVVSSITGVGFDQDIVEELHMALTDLRAELEESRAEAARAVKVAEQAIQSAENSNSRDWSSTVTHKAAEAAALAQKKSAEALAKARMAEERLDQEKRKASVWRKQAETAAEEAGYWQTRAAAADVQRAAMAEELESARQRILGGTSPPEGHSATTEKSELDRLRSKLAMESATRRKLLAEVQDLRGTVRVYCRPRMPTKNFSTISTPSQEVLLLHRERATFMTEGTTNNTPLSYGFDGILDSDLTQKELYDEMEAVCLSALDGYNVCMISYGQSGSGKTYTLLGDVQYGSKGEVDISNYGIHLRAAEQFFSVLERRSDRYKETIEFSLVEVSDERLSDLLVGTELGETQGRVEGSKRGGRRRIDSNDGTASNSEKPPRLEIKTNRDGETTVHGLLSVRVVCFEDIVNLWKQSLGKRRQRLQESGIDITEHDAISHVIGTLKVQSTNVATGVATTGKIQFVDLAAANVIPRRSTGSVSKKASTPESIMSGVGNNMEWKFANRSIATLTEVVNARSQFLRSVPYRNSTITHLLSDSLEADTKVVLVACVSSDLKDMQETACTLKFAQTMRRVVVGKATKHSRTTS